MAGKDLLSHLDTIIATLRYWIFEASEEDLQYHRNRNSEEYETMIKEIEVRLLDITSYSKILHQKLDLPTEAEATIAFNKPGEITWGPLEPRKQ